MPSLIWILCYSSCVLSIYFSSLGWMKVVVCGFIIFVVCVGCERYGEETQFLLATCSLLHSHHCLGLITPVGFGFALLQKLSLRTQVGQGKFLSARTAGFGGVICFFLVEGGKPFHWCTVPPQLRELSGLDKCHLLHRVPEDPALALRGLTLLGASAIAWYLKECRVLPIQLKG